MVKIKIKGLDNVECPLCYGTGNADYNPFLNMKGQIGFSWTVCNLCNGEGKIPLYILETYYNLTFDQYQTFNHNRYLRQILEKVYEGKLTLEKSEFDLRLEKMREDKIKDL